VGQLTGTVSIMFRFIRRLLIVLILLLAGLVLARNLIGNWVTASLFRRTTGFPVYIGSMDIKLTRAETILRDVSIRNPLDVFHEPRAIQINRLDLTYAPASLFRGPPHLYRVELEISEVVVVRNAAGELNTKRFERNMEKRKGGTTDGKTKEFQIDELVLSVGNILYLDEGRGATQPKVFPVNSHKHVYKNIKDSQDIHKIIMSQVSRALPAGLYLIPETIQGVKDSLQKGAQDILDLFKKKEPAQ
jgi:hypothetical protein